MPAQPSTWAKFNSRFTDLWAGGGWGGGETGEGGCRRHWEAFGGVINVAIRVLFNAYVWRRVCCVCARGGGEAEGTLASCCR